MWIWPTFARADSLKRGLLTGAVIVLAAGLLVAAPFVADSVVAIAIALGSFIVLGVAIRFLPATIRLRAIRAAEQRLRSSHPGMRTLVANVRDGDRSSAPYATRIIGIEDDALSFWDPEQLEHPEHTIERSALISADPGLGSPPRLRVEIAQGDGEPRRIQLAIFRARGTRPVPREQLEPFAAQLVAPRA